MSMADIFLAAIVLQLFEVCNFEFHSYVQEMAFRGLILFNTCIFDSKQITHSTKFTIR